MAPSTFSLSLFAPFLRRSKKYKKLETEEPEKRKQEEAIDELTRINSKIDKLLNSMTQEAPELADSGQASCVTCLESRAVMMVFPCNHTALCRLCFVKMIKHAVSSRQLPLCCVVCNSKIQRVKNNKTNTHPTPTNNRKSLPSSVSGYSLSKSISNYSIKSAGSATSQVSGRSVRSSPSLHSISSIKSNGSNSSWFSVNSLSSFQCAGLDKNHKQKLRPHSLLGSSQRTIKQSISYPAISDIIRAKVRPLIIITKTDTEVLQGPTISQSTENFSALPEPITPEVLSPSSTTVSRPLLRESQGGRRRVKSPEILETTFTMSTIQEEIENVNYTEQQSMLEI